jgi:hypothetical protein
LLGSNNRGIVVLTGVSTVTTKGSLSSNGRRYKARHLQEASRNLAAIEDSHKIAAEGKKLSIGRDIEEAVIVILQVIIIVQCVRVSVY